LRAVEHHGARFCVCCGCGRRLVRLQPRDLLLNLLDSQLHLASRGRRAIVLRQLKQTFKFVDESNEAVEGGFTYSSPQQPPPCWMGGHFTVP
jgi:hypothetical protein